MWHALAGRVRVGLPWLVYAIALALPLGAALGLDSGTKREARLEFDAQAADSAEHLQDRLRTYEQILYAMRGLFDVRGEVDREQFHRFARALLSGNSLPEVVDLTYMPLPGRAASAPTPGLAPSMNEEFVEPRADTLTSLKPAPEAEPDRQVTLKRAVTSGAVASSAFVPLSDAVRTGSGRGIVVMRLAVYRGGGVPATAGEREHGIEGFVGVSVRLDQLVRGTLLSGALERARVQVFEAPVASAPGRQLRGALLFDSEFSVDKSIASPATADQFLTVTRPLLMADRTWLSVFAPTQEPSDLRRDTLRFGLIFVVSLALAFVAAWLTHTMLQVALQRVELARSGARARELLAMGEDLHVCRDVAEADAVLQHQLPSLLPETSGVLYRHDAAAAQLFAAMHWGEPKVVETRLEPSDCQAIRRGQIFEGVGAGFGCAHVSGEYAGHYMCVPLTVQGELSGVLHVQLPDTSELEGVDLKTLSRSVAQQASLALANLQLRERLQDEADRDRLTGLYTRRFASAWLQHELNRCERAGCTMAAIMLDIDHFKRINDAFGHDAGDRMLQSLSRLLRESTRAADVACRYGGEEFLLLLPAATEQAAYARAEQIRRDAEALHVEQVGRDSVRVTVSAGVAVYPADGADVAALIQAADVALYAAKSAGRNRVACHSRLATDSVAPPAIAEGKDVPDEPHAAAA
jgi:diguanylate cyclase (GGDEF)-like protein